VAICVVSGQLMFGEGEKPMEPFSFSPKTILGRYVAFFGRRCFLSV